MFRPSQIDEASFEVRLKAKACECHEVDPKTVYVIPRDDSKDRRAVIWLLEGILCVSTDTGEICKANEIGNHCCYHVFAANRRREINAKRRATIRRKKFRLVAA